MPMPLTRGRAFSSAENGQRLEDAAFFSLEMLTTQGCTFRTASATSVFREAAKHADGPDDQQAAATTSARVQLPSRRFQGNGTLVAPLACSFARAKQPPRTNHEKTALRQPSLAREPPASPFRSPLCPTQVCEASFRTLVWIGSPKGLSSLRHQKIAHLA